MKKKRMKRIGLLLVIIAFAALPACGYQLIGGKGIYGGDISSVYISVITNSTYEPSISQPVTDSFSKELLMTGLFTLNKESSDGYLKGNITNVTTYASALGTDGIVIEKLVVVEMTAALHQRNGKLVKTFPLSDSEIYKIQNTAEEYNRREAIRRLSARMARRFTAQLMLEY
jgi:outer membrane lipopolysaccharide assembly protein LptE/RlpB